jgi:hypothetical protein
MARAAPEREVTPPVVPVAHYPRLRLLAKDVVGESPVLPLLPASLQGLAPAPAGRRSLRELEQMQQELVTSQVPAAAMLEAARAMKQLGAPVAPSRVERWGQLDLGTFGEEPPRASTPPQRTLSPLELGYHPALVEPVPSENAWRPARRYGRWLLLGALVGGVVGVLTVPSRQAAAPTAIGALRPAVAPVPPENAAGNAPPAPPRAVEHTPPTLSVAEEPARGAPLGAKPTAGIDQLKREGEAAVLHTLRAAKNDGFDRVVFEFRGRVPGYHVEYVDGPVRDCGAGDVRHIDGGAWLEVRFSPAYAHSERGEPTIRARELKPALSVVREIQKTCDVEGALTWVVGTASPHRYRVSELSAPPRLVVDIAH